MMRTVAGVFRNGAVELAEVPTGVEDDARVIVTFLDERSVSLRDRGIDADQARELRSALACFAGDWDDPAMDAYDDYDAAKSRL